DRTWAMDGSGGGAQMPAVLGKPTAAGVRPIRIEIPRAGQVFSFTKVLNATSEPLGVSVSMMRLKVYRTLQMILQVCAFGFGLLLLWALILLRSRRTFWMTVAVGLVLWSVTSLLTMWRVLHVGFIVLVPAIPLALIVWFGWRRWKGRKVAQVEPPPPIETGGGPATQAGLPLILAFALLGAAGGSVAQAQAPAALSDAVSITAASYTGSVGDKVAQFDAVIEISSTATNALAVPLFGEEIAIESFTADSGARLVREGRNIHVLLQPQSTVRLALRLAVRLGGDVTRRHLLFKIPPALSSRVDLVIQEADADVEFPTAVAFDRTSAGQQTRVQAFIGAADRLELNWTPRVKRAAEIAATVFVQNAALVQLGGGVLNTRATLDFQVSQGELRQIRVQVPSGQRVLRVEGESIRIWEVKEDTLVVDLLKGVSPAYKLTVETEKLLEKLPALAHIEIPHALDVKRETGFVALRGSEELSVTIEEARELQRVDAEEFQRVAPGEKGALLSAFRFLKTDFTLQVRAENVQPQIEATVLNQVRVDPESVRLSAQVAYTIKRAGVFGLRLGLPAGYRLDSVTGTNVSQWVERDEEGARTLEVTLKERTIGAYGLHIVLSRNFRAAPPSLLIEGVHPRGIEKLTGFIVLSTDHGLALKTQSLDALTEIPFTDAGLLAASRQAGITPSGALAYKFISPAPDAVPAWRLTVATEAVDPWVRAEIFNTITVGETLVSGRTVIQYDIANAPVREFRLRVPAAFKNIEITGAQIRRRDQTNDQWRVELQSKVRGAYLLTVTWELAKTAETRLVEFTGIEALAIERETGFIAVVARPPLLVTEKASTELLTRIDTRELPEWAGRVDAATVLAYRYLRPGYKLALEAKRFEEAEVLQALVDNARLTTVVADDGQVMTEVSLAIRNNGRQHLEVELPAGSTVWSAFIAGQPVRPSKQQGKLLLPLAREIGSDAPVAVELTFIGTNVFPKHRGQVALVSPRFDIPMKNARWDLYLPPDYEYGKFEGSMTRTSDAAAPMVQVYSLSEYNQQQRVQEEQQVTELKSGLKAARDNLTGGNLREALGSFNRAKARGGFFNGGERDKDLQQVEQDLRRAQSSNLIVAQNNYYFENAGRLGEQSMPGQSAQQQIAKGKAEATVAMNYDEGVAGQQWDKLERAQQIAVAKVAPLRVNLPTRGVHYTFSQVLQTEVRKPMTIRLVAESTKAPSWTSRILLSVAGFVTLWGMVALANHRRLRATQPRPS
ncbi:MAG TPA: hypothetical protein VN673_01145, partial [Clostridia bacterium]|nr:hypothetical protein [Clostridia bacterium]